MEDINLSLYQEEEEGLPSLTTSFILIMCQKCGVGLDENTYEQHMEQCKFNALKQDVAENGMCEPLSGESASEDHKEQPANNLSLSPSENISKKEKKETKNRPSALLDSSSGSDNSVSCPICSQIIAHRRNLKRHINSKHENNSFVQCDICLKQFSHEDTLKRHYTFTHQNPSSFKCNLCENVYNQKSHLDNHIIRHHTTVRRFKCDNCDFGTMVKTAFLKHIFKCVFNNNESEFDANSDQILNKIQNEPVVVRCSLCETDCPSISALLKHIKSHGEEKNTSETNNTKQESPPPNYHENKNAKEIDSSPLNGNKNVKRKKIYRKEGVKKTCSKNMEKISVIPRKKDQNQSQNCKDPESGSSCSSSSISVVVGNENEMCHNRQSQKKVSYQKRSNYYEEKCEKYNFVQTDAEEIHSSGKPDVALTNETELSLEMKAALAKALNILYREILLEEDLEKYRCKLCSITCLSAMALENHMKRHL